MSRRRDHRRKNHHPNSRQPGPAAPIKKHRAPATQSQKLMIVSILALLLAGVGWLWYSNGPKRPGKFEATDLNSNALPTEATMGTTSVPTNTISLLTSTAGVSNSAAKPAQASVRLNQQANELMNAGDMPGAIRLYEQAIRLTPDDEDLHYNLGIAYAKAGDFTNAEQQYREALRLLPDYAEVHNNLGNLLLRGGRLDEAAEQLNEAVKLQPEYAAAYNNLGIVRQKQKRLEEATLCFQKAVAYDANYLEAHFNLASASLLAGNR